MADVRSGTAGGALLPLRADALLYLTGASLRNRVLGGLRRLRNPRYAAAIVFGAIYLWFALLRPSAGSGGIARGILGPWGELVITLAVVAFVVWGWFTSAESRSLAFSEAEVHFLFPAPLSRRALVGYKIWRSQLMIAFNALIWVFVLRRGGGEGLPALARYLAVWIVLSNVSLQRLGAALVRVTWQQHGRHGVRRQIVPIAIFAVGLVVLADAAWNVAPALRASTGIGNVLDVLSAASRTVAVEVVLFPFRVALAPVFTHDVASWARAMGPSVVVAVLQVFWVLRTDAAFEEAAVQASADRARRIRLAGRSSPGERALARAPRAGSAKRTLPLRPIGNPMAAIVWKNILCLLRTGQLVGTISLVLMAFTFTAVMSSDFGSPAEWVATFSLLLFALIWVMGTRLLRIDLRQDMLHLEALKGFPLRGRDIVAAEIASSTLPIAVVQIALVLVAYVALLTVRDAPLTLSVRTALVLISPVAIVAFAAASLTIQNAAALLFPAWVRLGTDRPSGIETLGQGILTTVASMLVLVMSLVLPAILGGILWWVLGRAALATAVGSVAASVVLLGEVWWAIGRLGGVLERSEPVQQT